jgi:hypothetical protein
MLWGPLFRKLPRSWSAILASKVSSAGNQFVGLIFFVFFVACAIVWIPRGFFNFQAEAVGEIFEAYHGAINLLSFGWRWAGLQDMATNPSPAAHPFLYSHHGNLGLYFSYMLAKVGISSIEAQNAISWLASFTGLVFAYRFSRRFGAGVIVLLLLALDFEFIDNWALNVHRAFTYFSVFGAALAFMNCTTTTLRVRNIISFVLLAIVLLFADYIFFFFEFFMLATLVLFLHWRQWAVMARSLALLIVTFVGAFLLRQVQVIIGAGWNIWTHDFLYQLLNRIHAEYLYAGNWPQATTEFYDSNNILNPGFAPSASWFERISGFVTGTGDAVLVHVLNVGHFSGINTVLGAAVIIGVVVHSGLTISTPRSRLALSFLIAAIAMYALFPRYFLQWYPAFLLAPICAFIWIASVFEGYASSWMKAAAICLKIAVVLVGAFTRAVDTNAQAAILRGLRDQAVVSNFTPASVSSYTDCFAGWLKDGAVQRLLTSGRVTVSDYAMIFEADRNTNPLYQRPAYFAFFKAYGTREQLAAIKAVSEPVAENSVIALFRPRRTAADVGQ